MKEKQHLNKKVQPANEIQNISLPSTVRRLVKIISVLQSNNQWIRDVNNSLAPSSTIKDEPIDLNIFQGHLIALDEGLTAVENLLLDQQCSINTQKLLLLELEIQDEQEIENWSNQFKNCELLLNPTQKHLAAIDSDGKALTQEIPAKTQVPIGYEIADGINKNFFTNSRIRNAK